MRRPPALRAIIPACFSHDRYHVDVHWWGGARLIGGERYWPVEMVGENALPPDPERFGPGWREEWLRRLEATPQWPFSSLRHQRRDDHWTHGSAIEDWGSIERGRPRPRRARRLVPRQRPGDGGQRPGAGARDPRARGATPGRTRVPPGPTIDGVGLMTRWWDRWLKGERERRRRRARRSPCTPWSRRTARRSRCDVAPPSVPGRWWAIRRWPSVAADRAAAAAPPRRRRRGTGRDAGPGAGRCRRCARHVGRRAGGRLTAPFTCTGWEPQGGPLDQRPDDARSLVYTGAPLDGAGARRRLPGRRPVGRRRPAGRPGRRPAGGSGAPTGPPRSWPGASST